MGLVHHYMGGAKDSCTCPALPFTGHLIEEGYLWAKAPTSICAKMHPKIHVNVMVKEPGASLHNMQCAVRDTTDNKWALPTANGASCNLKVLDH